LPDGFIVLDKPIGLGSTQAVAAAKRNLRAAGFGKVKVGHGGMLDASKDYAFTVAFGAETETLDLESKVVERSARRPTLRAVEAVLPDFVGPIEHVPPAYSALMIDGRRAYERARAGEAVTIPTRQVIVHSLRVYLPAPAGEDLNEITFVAHVSKGTYIRSLARDLARALGTVGHVTMLRRTRAGPFGLSTAISLDNLNAIGQGALLENILLPLEAGLDDIPALDLGPEQARAVREGRVLTGLAFQDGVCWARQGLTPVALMQVEGGDARVLRGFNLS
jgi:tRNA pseudouridine55 synthase